MSQQVNNLVKRATAAFAALGLGAAITLVSVLSPSPSIVHALTGGQVQSRAIYMSNSTPSATNQSYLVSFKPASTTPIKGIVLDFCSTTPIVGDTSCTKPTGFSVGGASPTVTFTQTTLPDNAGSATTPLPGSWTATGTNPGAGAESANYRTLKLDNSAGTGALNTSTIYNFTIGGVKNPSTLGTFYARIITYSDDTAGTSDFANYAPGTEGSTTALDYGGFALSTANDINITAKVQETLTFCTSQALIDGTGSTNNCSQATNPALTLGHGTPVATIDNSQVDAATAYMQLSTNATSGAVIRMHAKNSCSGSSNNAGLSSNGGTICNIAGVDNTTAAPLSTTVPNTGPTGLFGLSVLPGYTTTGVAASSGYINPDPNYYNSSHTTEGAVNPDLYFGMDNNATTGVNGTYGDVIATTANPTAPSVPLPCNTMNAHLVFAAIASLTTPAGIYQGAESLIATGTF